MFTFLRFSYESLKPGRRVFVFSLDKSQASSADGRVDVSKRRKLVSSCWMEYSTRGTHILILKLCYWSARETEALALVVQ